MIEPENDALEALARIHHPAGRLQLGPEPEGDTIEVLTGRVALGRWDHEVIGQIVAGDSTVLDLGCGRGSLLSDLRIRKRVRGQGIEKDPEKVAACVAAGVPVIQGDLDAGSLAIFPDDAFDYVILEMTLQTVTRPRDVVREMLRIGRVGVVSFPNFGHWRIREQLVEQGRAPITDALPFAWYDTPNIRVLTIRDFEDFCVHDHVHILDRYVLAHGRYRPMHAHDNWIADEALYVVCRDDTLSDQADGGGI